MGDAHSTDSAPLLEKRVREAQLAYQRALQEYRRLMGISADTTSLKDPALADGNLALRRAMQMHRNARQNYERALKEFTDFILKGKSPDGLGGKRLP